MEEEEVIAKPEIIANEKSLPRTTLEDVQTKLTSNLEFNPAQVQTTQPQTMSKKPISSKQAEHLEYARQCKKLKQVGRETDRQITNSNLDFIYRRLTNIENQIRSMADPSQPISTRGIKRVPNKDVELYSSDGESITMAKKLKKAEKENDPDSQFWGTVKGYAARGAFVFGAGIVFTIAKNYWINGRRTTQDGEQIGSYYIGPDN